MFRRDAPRLSSALRLGDACLLRWEDVALHTGRISVIPRKTLRTGKRVTIPLHPVLRTLPIDKVRTLIEPAGT